MSKSLKRGSFFLYHDSKVSKSLKRGQFPISEQQGAKFSKLGSLTYITAIVQHGAIFDCLYQFNKALNVFVFLNRWRGPFLHLGVFGGLMFTGRTYLRPCHKTDTTLTTPSRDTCSSLMRPISKNKGLVLCSRRYTKSLT